MPPPEHLLQEIARSPNDADLRRVYADALLEHGDPWGELIHLQEQRSAESTAHREAEIIHRHGPDWLGPLANVLDLEQTTFEHGFPVVCRSRSEVTGKQIETVLRDPRWALTREINGLQPVWNRLLLQGDLPSLRVLKGLDARFAVRLLLHHRGRLPFEALDVRHALTYQRGRLDWGAEEIAILGQGDRLPHLRQLRFAAQGPAFRSFPTPRLFRPFWASPLGRRLEHFGVPVMSLAQVLQWRQECEEHGAAFRGRLELCMPGLSLTFERDDRGSWSRLSMDVDRRRDVPPVDGLIGQTLRILPDDSLTRFVASGNLDQPELIATALERQYNLQEMTLPNFQPRPHVATPNLSLRR